MIAHRTGTRTIWPNDGVSITVTDHALHRALSRLRDRWYATANAPLDEWLLDTACAAWLHGRHTTLPRDPTHERITDPAVRGIEVIVKHDGVVFVFRGVDITGDGLSLVLATVFPDERTTATKGGASC